LHHQLDTRPGIADVSADGLALRFHGTPGLDVVATSWGTLEDVGLVVVVEVLAASHRVHLLDDDGVLATEQVACVDPAPDEGLPEQAAHEVRGHLLVFRAERPHLDASSLTALASDLRSTAGDEQVLVVSFPGHADALTSVRVLGDGWETWHLYPGRRPHAVRTRTCVVAA
jgi:Protein of unknown function DUF2617